MHDMPSGLLSSADKSKLLALAATSGSLDEKYRRNTRSQEDYLNVNGFINVFIIEELLHTELVVHQLKKRVDAVCTYV